MRKLAVSAVVTTIVVLAALSAKSTLDDAGWIPHREVTATYIGQNGWIPGEYRDCIGVPTQEGTLTPPRGVFGGYLACDLEGHAQEDLDHVTARELSVTYWGRISRHDMGDNDDHWRELKGRNAVCAKDARSDQERFARRGLCDEDKHIGKIEWFWHCRRNESSLTCWAVN